MLLVRMLRAARFDARLYEELRRDRVAPAQAIAILAIALVAMVTGALLFVTLASQPIGILLLALIDPLALWLLPAMSLYLLGGLARVNNPERGSDRDLIITIGFSSSPGILWLVPHPIFAFAVWAWVMAGMILGARATLNISLARSIMYIIPGLLLYWLLFSILPTFFGSRT